MDLETAFDLVETELNRAMIKHSPMTSMHEGYAVILEEMEELWDEIKARHRDMTACTSEATQLAAMATRFLIDLCRTPEG